ncbi:MAG: hypothetical protein ABJM47_03155, partial [Lentilitoribacter sp.]
MDLNDAGYRGLLRSYADEVLPAGKQFSDAQFDLAMEKAQHRFLFLSFIVEQVALGQIDLADLNTLRTGVALFKDYLGGLRQELGHRRLIQEAEDILLALAAEERAHTWQSDEGLCKGLHGDELLTDEQEWRGMRLERLSRYLDRDIAGGQDSYFLYTVFRLKSALGINRGGSGEARLRLWLKDLAAIIAADEKLGARLPQMHARAASLLLEEETSEYRAYAHAVLSGSEPLLHKVRDTDELLEHAINKGVEHAENRSDYASAIRNYNTAISVLLMRFDQTGQQSADDINSLATAYSNRAVAKGDAFGEAEAIPDYDAAIKIRENLRDEIINAGQQWPPEYRNNLAGAYMNRAVAKMQAIGPAEAIPDYDAAIKIRENLRDEIKEAGQQWPPEYRNDLAAAYSNRAVAKGDAFGEAEAI